ncbi:MAG: glycerophosphodiester phosphodiesterase [Acidimicrobiales bacterium]
MTLVLAHRGHRVRGPGPAPGCDNTGGRRENTLEAFAAARAAGADGVELDVRRSADGALVVHHDAEIPGAGRLANLRRAELPGYVPVLAEALAACGPMLVDVELKHDPKDDPGRLLAASVASALMEGKGGEGILVSSFDAGSLDVVTRRAPDLPTGLILHWSTDRWRGLEQAVAHGCSSVHPFVTQVDRPFVEQAHELGLEVGPWTVNRHEDLVEMVTLGVDAVVTDRLVEALAAVRQASNGGTGAR